MSAATVAEPAAVHAARSHGDPVSVELVEAWDLAQATIHLQHKLIGLLEGDESDAS
jgi:hypothetical protein